MVPIDGTLTGIFDKSKIDVAINDVSTIEVSKTKVLTTEITTVGYNSIVEGGCSLVDEVVATSAMVTLS